MKTLNKGSIIACINIFTILLSFLFINNIYAADLTGNEIIEKTFNLYGGKDSTSKLTFIFKEKGVPDRKIVSTRIWKYYKGKDGIDSKIILFNEFPPDQKGTAFMSWIYSPEANKKDDMWLYLPQLRKVRKLSERDEEDFPGSELKTADLAPRYPNLDNHKLISKEKIKGSIYYKVESTPKEMTEKYPYKKVIRWISAKDFTPIKVDYYDIDGDLLKKQFTRWKKYKKAFIWDKVMAKNVQNGNQTILSISDLKVDIGIDDDIFSTRTMELGPDSLN